MAQYVWMSRCLEGLPAGTLKTIDCHDVCSTHAEKVEAFGIKEPFMMTVAQEVERLARADVVIAIHAGERDALQRMGLEAEVVTVGVDLEEQPSQRSPIPGRILCVAADNEPNIRGLRDFLHISWPVIHVTRLDVRLHVVGRVTRYLARHGGGLLLGLHPRPRPCVRGRRGRDQSRHRRDRPQDQDSGTFTSRRNTSEVSGLSRG